jgi:hypothetical protein
VLAREIGPGEAREMLNRVMLAVLFAAIMVMALLPQPTGVSWV